MRVMSPALAIRFTVLMTLIPTPVKRRSLRPCSATWSSCPGSGPARCPPRQWPGTWREALGPAPPERLRDVMLAGVDGEHRSRD